MDASVESADVEAALPKAAKAVGRHENLPRRLPNPTRTSRIANPGAPDMKRPKRPSSEVKAALERKKEHRRQSKMLEKAKVEAMAAMEIEDMLSDSLDSEEGEEEPVAAATDIDDTLDDFLGDKGAAAPNEAEWEGEDNSEGEDEDGVIMMVTASTKDTTAKESTVSQSLVRFMKGADK
jgi:hypothetical protein